METEKEAEMVFRLREGRNREVDLHRGFKFMFYAHRYTQQHLSILLKIVKQRGCDSCTATSTKTAMATHTHTHLCL